MCHIFKRLRGYFKIGGRLNTKCVFMCVLAVYNKAQAQIISNREFKLWTFLQGTESRVATHLSETYDSGVTSSTESKQNIFTH